MNDIITLIVSAVFYLIIAALGFLSLLGIFIVVKYGRSHVVTLLASLAYSGIFLLFFLSAFLTLQKL